MLKLTTKKRDEKPRGLGRLKRFEPLFDPEEASGICDEFTERMMDGVNALRCKKFFKGESTDDMRIAESYRMDSQYVPTQVLETIPSGDIRLDLMLAVDRFNNRGIPRGKCIEMSGEEEMMKSARAAAMVAAIQKDPRGAIVHWHETENKVNARYIKAAGCDISRIIITLPDYIEQVYYDTGQRLREYIKVRDRFVTKYIRKHHTSKTITPLELEELIFRGRMSFPIFVDVYDSIGNHRSKESYQKSKKGTTTKTPGKHAQAHADGYREIVTPLGNAMGIFIVINHTKDEFSQGQHSSWGAKKTTTYGGRSIKFMSSIRIEHKKGIGKGGPKSTFLKVTRRGKELIVGKWLTLKFIKNSLVETSHQRIEHVLFRYKPGVCFDMGVSYLLALEEAGHTKGPIKLTSKHKNKIIVPGGKVVEATFRDLHDMLASNNSLRNGLRKLLVNHANENSILVRKDV